MLRKRVFILFFTIFLFNVYGETDLNVSDKKIIDTVYQNSRENIYVEGEVTIGKEIIPIALQQKKNKYDFYNISIKFNNDIYELVTNELETNISLNKKSIPNNTKLLSSSIPLEILNYAIRNSSYLILEKPSKFKYKNLPCYKIVIKENEIIEEKPEEELSIPVTKEDKITEEDTTDTNEQDKENEDQQLLSTENTKIIEEVETKKIFPPQLFKKVIYYISDTSNLILKKEFYYNKTDRTPAYIIETEDINYIQGNYFINNLIVTDTKTKQSITFKYNIETISYDVNTILEQ